MFYERTGSELEFVMEYFISVDYSNEMQYLLNVWNVEECDR